MTTIVWRPARVGTSLRGYLDNLTYGFEETIARLRTLSGQNPEVEDGDKVSVEFEGWCDGQPFTLYDYKGDDDALHIGGSGQLDVHALKARLAALLADVAPSAYAARVPSDYGGRVHGWPNA